MPSYRAAASVMVAAGAVTVFFVAADFFTGALFAAFAAGAFTWAFLMATFFGPGAAFLAAALAFAALAALAFFRFATSLAFAAAESFLFGLGAGAGADGSTWTLDAAHLFRCASAIAFRPAALIFRRLRLPVGTSDVAAGSAGPPEVMARSSAIWASMRNFCCSKPSMAAEIISGVSCFGMCDVLSDSLYPAFTAGPILHLTQSLIQAPIILAEKVA